MLTSPEYYCCVEECKHLPKNAKANFAITVEVGVETHCVVPSGDKFDTWGVDGVVRRAAEQEEEEATLIRCVKGTCD